MQSTESFVYAPMQIITKSERSFFDKEPKTEEQYNSSKTGRVFTGQSSKLKDKDSPCLEEAPTINIRDNGISQNYAKKSTLLRNEVQMLDKDINGLQKALEDAIANGKILN